MNSSSAKHPFKVTASNINSHDFYPINSLLKSVLIAVLLLSSFWSPFSFAQKLPEFKASFSVEALGMTLGEAKQSFSCMAEKCTLTSDAKPSGLAALFSSDSSHESVELINTDKELIWQQYTKIGTRVKDGKSKQKTTTLIRDTQSDQISYAQKNRSWPNQAKVYDALSLAYAIQYAVLNEQSLQDFYLQDTSFQDKLLLKQKPTIDSIELSRTNKSFSALKYEFSSEHTQIELWLLPNYSYFPGKIRVVNHHQKTITLTLAELPKNYETQR